MISSKLTTSKNEIVCGSASKETRPKRKKERPAVQVDVSRVVKIRIKYYSEDDLQHCKIEIVA
jgi:hypothetical protein